MNNDRHERLFFALALESPTNQPAFRQLCQLIQILPGDGRRVPDCNLHLTLAFLGLVSELQKEHLLALTSALTLPAFSLHTSILKYQKRSRLIWLGCNNVPAPLEQLAADLKEAAEQVGLKQEGRKYTPHITLKKHVRQRPESLPENNDFTFHFQHFGLYISEQVKTARGSGVRYRCLQQWPLSQTKPDNQDPE